jgi:histidyl-tRNA synthetase
MYKQPKGTIDYFGDNGNKLKYSIKEIENIFIKYGGKFLDTPTFERKDILMGKYGEEAETKLIYELKQDENGGELLALKYDQTVPFIRFLTQNKIEKIKRYSISKVFRRDNPNINQGRYREFYQADFDIVGESNTNMYSEILIFNMIDDILLKLGITDYIIKINDTNNLKNILLNELKIEQLQFKTICSTIDKLDKKKFDELIDEFKLKNLNDEQINKLKFILQSNNIYCETFKNNLQKIKNICNDKIQYDISLARGLDYYNGIIFEVKINNFDSTIIAGGRYDGIIKNTLIGFSVGITRILNFINISNDWKNEYYLTTIGDTISDEAKFTIFKYCKNNISKDNPINMNLTKDKNLKKVIMESVNNKIRYLIIIAEEELKNNNIIIKDLKESKQEIVKIN